MERPREIPFTEMAARLNAWLRAIGTSPAGRKHLLVIGETHAETGGEPPGNVIGKQLFIINQIRGATELLGKRIKFITEMPRDGETLGLPLDAYQPKEHRRFAAFVNQYIKKQFPGAFAYSSVTMDQRTVQGDIDTVGFREREDRLYLEDVKRLFLDNDIVVFIVGSAHLYGLYSNMGRILGPVFGKDINRLFINTSTQTDYIDAVESYFGLLPALPFDLIEAEFPPIEYDDTEQSAEARFNGLLTIGTLPEGLPKNSRYRILMTARNRHHREELSRDGRGPAIPVPARLRNTVNTNLGVFEHPAMDDSEPMVRLMKDVKFGRLTMPVFERIEKLVNAALKREVVPEIDLSTLYERFPQLHSMPLEVEDDGTPKSSIYDLFRYLGFSPEGTKLGFIGTKPRTGRRLGLVRAWLTETLEHINELYAEAPEEGANLNAFDANFFHGAVDVGLLEYFMEVIDNGALTEEFLGRLNKEILTNILPGSKDAAAKYEAQLDAHFQNPETIPKPVPLSRYPLIPVRGLARTIGVEPAEAMLTMIQNILLYYGFIEVPTERGLRMIFPNESVTFDMVPLYIEKLLTEVRARRAAIAARAVVPARPVVPAQVEVIPAQHRINVPPINTNLASKAPLMYQPSTNGMNYGFHVGRPSRKLRTRRSSKSLHKGRHKGRHKGLRKSRRNL